MLDTQDIKQLGDLIEERVRPIVKTEVNAGKSEIIEAVGEMIEQNVLPAINNLPDKAYLDDKIADLEGTTVVRQRKEDQKVNLLIEFLQKKQVLGEQEVRQLREFHVFPAPPALA